MKGIIVIGSNSGEREKNIEDAIIFIGKLSSITKMSPVYESPDCLGSGKKYLNAVIMIDTHLSEQSLNGMFKDYERKAGRSEEKNMLGDVPIDIDVVVWNNDIRRAKDFNAKYFIIGYQNMKEMMLT